MNLGLVFGSVVFLIAGITLASYSLDVVAQSDLEIDSVDANAKANATGEAMTQAENILNLTSDAASNATQTAMNKIMDIPNTAAKATENPSKTEMDQITGISNKAANASTNATSIKYESPDIGIKFTYPSDWEPFDLTPDCREKTNALKICYISFFGFKPAMSSVFISANYPKENPDNGFKSVNVIT